MTKDIVENTAEAIWKARAEHFGELAMPMVHDERYELFKAYARAAITAHQSALSSSGYVIVPREPTLAMLEAIQTEVDIWPEETPKPSPNCVQFISREEASDIWSAVLAAASKEKPPE